MELVKFGGSSMATAANIRMATNIIRAKRSRRIVVVSAPGKFNGYDEKITDQLIRAYNELKTGGRETLNTVFGRFENIAGELLPENKLTAYKAALYKAKNEILNNAADYNFIVSRGEFLTAKLFALYLDFNFVDAGEILVINGDATANLPATERNIKTCRLKRRTPFVIGGFYGAAANPHCSGGGPYGTISKLPAERIGYEPTAGPLHRGGGFYGSPGENIPAFYGSRSQKETRKPKTKLKKTGATDDACFVRSCSRGGSRCPPQTALFSRGGSDYTGAVLSALFNVKKYENFTDTNGIQTADPRIVCGTKTIPFIDFDALDILTRNGAGVIHENVAMLLKACRVPLKVDSTFAPDKNYTEVHSTKCKKCGSPFFSITAKNNQITIVFKRGQDRIEVQTVNTAPETQNADIAKLHADMLQDIFS